MTRIQKGPFAEDFAEAPIGCSDGDEAEGHDEPGTARGSMARASSAVRPRTRGADEDPGDGDAQDDVDERWRCRRI